MGDDLLTQIGLMLTQLRYARRALEDIERSTARYAGFAFASALQAGPAFGAPPLEAGALRVHVVNIGDLTPGAGFGGFLESLLGGVGRFFGGLIGGFVGGTISGFNLPGVIASMLELAKRIERILGILGLSFAEDKDKGKKQATPTLKAQFDDIKDVLSKITALLIGAGAGPDKAGEIAKPVTKGGQEWLPVLQTADALIRGISRVVDGLIILIPTLIGALASVIVHLRDIQAAVLGLLQFMLKEVFLLRGVVLFTLWDTIAGAARLAAQVLSTLNGALQTILTSIGGIFTKIFDAGLEILKFLAAGIKGTVDTLLRWLVDTVGAVLIALGDSKIFRVVIYVVQMLPALLPPLLQLIDKPIQPGDRTALEEAAKKTKIEGPDPKLIGKKLSETIPEFPDLAKTFTETAAKETKIADLGDVAKKAFDGVKADIKSGFDASINALNDIGARLDEVKKDKSFLDALDKREDQLRESSKQLADTLAKAQEALAKRPDTGTGLDIIANKYDEWLTGGGMKSILDKIEAHFKESPNTGEFGPPLPSTAVERPRATVEIKELVIELDPAAENAPASPASPTSLEWPAEPYDPLEREHELRERCFIRAPGAPMLWS